MECNNCWKRDVAGRISELVGDVVSTFAATAKINAETLTSYIGREDKKTGLIKRSLPGSIPLLKIAKTADVSIDYILTGEEYSSPDWTVSLKARTKYAFLKNIITRTREEAERNISRIGMIQAIIKIMELELGIEEDLKKTNQRKH